MSTAPLMLGVSGCRGIAGQSLTPDVAARYAASVGAWLARRGGAGRPRVVLARDGRAGGEVMHAAAAAGLRGAGLDVLDLGVAMTPSVGVMVDRLGAAGGLIITASHNPQDWNGLKALVRASGSGDASDACAPDAGSAQEIIELFRASQAPGVPWDRVGGQERVEGACDTHVERVLHALRSLSGDLSPIEDAGFRVAVDSVNASGGEGARLLLEALGCSEILALGAEDTGLFPHPPEPLRENLQSLAEAVRESGSAVGLAQDPDADRLALIDERGQYVGEEYTLALAAESLLSAMGDRARGAVLATNLSTSRMIEDIARRHGARVVRTPVGEANVVDAMKRGGAVLGGEGNGGVIWPAVTFVRDSLSAMALVLSLMARTGRPLSALAGEVPAYAIEKRKVELPDRAAADRAVARVAGAYADQRLDRQDGVRVDFDARRAWLHVRASNTEPIMRLIAEAPTPQDARAVLDDAQRVIAG